MFITRNINPKLIYTTKHFDKLIITSQYVDTFNEILEIDPEEVVLFNEGFRD